MTSKREWKRAAKSYRRSALNSYDEGFRDGRVVFVIRALILFCLGWALCYAVGAGVATPGGLL